MSQKDVPDGTRPAVMAMCKGPGAGAIALPTGVGSIGHDPTRFLNPAWSIGGRDMRGGKTLGPGPHKYNFKNNLTRRGPDGQPVHSMAPTYPHGKIEVLPGPGQYAPEKYPNPPSERAPTHIFGRRTRYRYKTIGPGPIYDLPPMTGNPQLPCNKVYPHYTMRSQVKYGHYTEDFTKAPNATRYSAPDFRHYKNREPSYTCRPKVYPPVGDRSKPGPGAHCPEKVYVNKRTAPAFSFGVRHSDYTTLLFTDPESSRVVTRKVKAT